MITSAAADRAPIELLSWGTGRGVVLVEGGGTDATTYRRLAERLAEHLTVHVYNRRGRGRSAPQPADYGLATEVGDLSAALTATGSSRVIGHSVGGYFAMAAARTLPIERLALYDPAVSIDGEFPRDFLPAFERAAASGDARAAMAIAGRGLNPDSNLPDSIQRAMLGLVLLTPPGRTMADLIVTVPPEAKLAAADDGPASAWTCVAAATRFYIGARSPKYYASAARKLVAAMPTASLEIVPRLGHDALARASAQVVTSLTEFLLS